MKITKGMAAIVTGGASGLGEATARALAAQGARVALFDMNGERGEKVAAAIGGLFCLVDVTNEASVDAGLAAARAAHGQERVLVNCAGIVAGKKTVGKDRETGLFKSHDLSLFSKVIQVNLVGSFHMITKCATGMAGEAAMDDNGGRGVVVNTASIAATDGQMGQAAYSASKGGIMGFTLPVARDLAQLGIRVCTIMPGLFHTPMFDSLPPDVVESLGAKTPFPARLGKGAEYAKLALHIIDNDMLNGESIRLDGAIRLEPR
ncbi:SDR family NAD(P)-dependent oxidoreductase [Cohaesibacter sp. CAU 1516]|uniref:SDR family NAD(P)-dependent oxidoreductase n=1 Tax=Cohaesibacter sp. CAU 1516 TaxID=2576038 RepID=UPI0010FD6F1A|nr:SDR family NAD(P)-dependent oxidoreductase [Cohaesibacter sp. CAU 1516]TLP46963.1 SDR family NAD(P)-dependent oxidoreductase [Cohaesibacter sp. CAU 1516]